MLVDALACPRLDAPRSCRFRNDDLCIPQPVNWRFAGGAQTPLRTRKWAECEFDLRACAERSIS